MDSSAPRPGNEQNQNSALRLWKRLTPVQRVTASGSIALILVVLFPPFVAPVPINYNLGFGFLFDPPHYLQTPILGTVNTSLLGIEVLIVLAISVFAYLAVRKAG